MKDKDQIQFLKSFGKKVKELRLKHNITIVQMAFEMNCDEKQIRRIEKGEINTGILSIYKIANILEINHKDLLEF